MLNKVKKFCKHNFKRKKERILSERNEVAPPSNGHEGNEPVKVMRIKQKALAQEPQPKVLPYAAMGSFAMLRCIGTDIIGGRTHAVNYRDQNIAATINIRTKRELVDDELKMKRSKAELQVLQRLFYETMQPCPFLLGMISHFQTHDSVCVVSEFCAGGDLFSVIQASGDGLGEKKANFITAELVQALRCLHSMGICHNGVRPENIFIEKTGHIKLGAFHLSEQIGPMGVPYEIDKDGVEQFAAAPQTSRTHSLFGTPEYIAPEIVLRKGHNCAADMWALGVLIYELITKTLPFFAHSPIDIYRLVVAGEVVYHESSRYRRPLFSKGTEAFIKRCLDPKEPDHNRWSHKGRGRITAHDARKHAWLAKCDWEALVRIFWCGKLPSLLG